MPICRPLAALGLLAGLAACAISPATKGDLGTLTSSGAYLASRLADVSQDAPTASVLLDRLLVESPANPILLQRALFQNLVAGQLDQAEKVAIDLVATRPGHGLARMTLGVRAAARGAWPNARDHLSAIQEGPAGLVAPLLIAWTFEAEGQSDQALAEADKAIAQGRLIALAHTQKALILDHAGRSEEAKAAFEAVLNDGDTSLRVIASYAALLKRSGEDDKAQALMNRLVDAVPDLALVRATRDRLQGPAAPPRSPAMAFGETLFDVGSALAQERTGDVATIFVRLALEISPDLDEGKVALGALWARHDRLEEGLALFSQVPATSDHYETAQVGRASALADHGRADEAEMVLRALATRLSTSPTPYTVLGDLLREREKFQPALDAYSAALARSDNNAKKRWQIYYARGVTLERLNRWPEAQADLDLALLLRPDEPAILNYLGYSLLDRDLDAKRARQLIERAASLRPKDGYIVDSLGWAQFRAGEVHEAVATLERAIALKPDDATINDHLGDAYWHVGRKLEARFQWRHALTYKPDDDQKARIERKLDYGLDLADKIEAAASKP